MSYFVGNVIVKSEWYVAFRRQRKGAKTLNNLGINQYYLKRNTNTQYLYSLGFKQNKNSNVHKVEPRLQAGQ